MMTKRCPSTQEIVGYLEDEGSRTGSRRELLDHVAACPECRAIFEASLEVGAKAGTLLQSLEGVDLKSPAAVRRLRGLARHEIRLLRRAGSRRRRAYPRWLAIPAAGAALALAAALILVPSRPSGGTDGRERGALASDVGLVRPQGTVPGAGLDFQWTRGTGVRHYRLEIYDRMLEPVYESAPLTRDRLALPGDTLSSLERGTVYFWKVVATLESGQTIESEFASFVIQK